MVWVDTWVCCLCACVEHSVKLPVQFVGRVVFDTSESEGPSAGESAKFAADFSPGSKMSFRAVVGNVTGPVSGNGCDSALAFRDDVVVV